MRRLYREGKIGEFEYGECEYVHNCEPIWPSITYGERDHWRNNMYSTFYCTHSLGPIIHMTGLRPVSVVGFEGTQNARAARVGSKAGSFGIEMVTLENGGIIKSLHGGLYKDSIWYSVYGSKGRMESAREDARMDAIYKIHVNADEYEGEYSRRKPESYHPKRELDEQAQGFGHGYSDFYTMYNFVEKLLGNPEADTIDVYEALDMFLPGMFAYRSILDGNVPKEIPNLRDQSARDLWRNDTACTIPEKAGDMLQPTFSLGTPDIDDSVYERVRTMWEEECAKKENKE
jgi:predicted dehydrogenase